MINNWSGIYISTSFELSQIVADTIRYCTITGNGDVGSGNTNAIVIEDYGNVVINNNNIDNHYLGIKDINNYSTNDIDARFNWWGEATTAEMENGENPKNIASIYDYFDYSQRGEVVYAGWLSEIGGDAPSTITTRGTILLTDVNGNEQVSFSSGSSVYVYVEDADRNTDTNTVQSVTASLASDTEAVGETVTLNETGVSTGVFTGSIQLFEDAAVQDDGILQVVSGDNLTGSYIDPFRRIW